MLVLLKLHACRYIYSIHHLDCQGDVDLYIVLDSSGSVGSASFEVAKNFIANFISGFTIGESHVRVGLIRYATSTSLIFDLDESFEAHVVLESIRSVEYTGGLTATGDGIYLMTYTGFTEAYGARPHNLAIPRVGLVLTDGNSNRGIDVVTASQLARDQLITLFAFGIGSGIDESELLEIAGSSERWFRIDSFINIDDARALITRGSCQGRCDCINLLLWLDDVIIHNCHLVLINGSYKTLKTNPPPLSSTLNNSRYTRDFT